MLASLSKYRRYLAIDYQRSLEFRFSIFCSIAVFMLPLVAKVVFWKAVYAGTNQIGGFDVADMVTYLLVFQFVVEMTYAYPGQWNVRPDIIRGGLSRHLLLPENYVIGTIYRSLGNKFPRWSSSIVIFAVLILLFGTDVKLPTQPWIWPAFALSLVVSYFLLMLYSILLGMLAFWVEGQPPLIEPLGGPVFYLFAGWIVPMGMLPHWLRAVADVLPFQYMLHFPAVVFLGKVPADQFARGSLLQMGWMLVLIVAMRLAWRAGIRRYGAYGG